MIVSPSLALHYHRRQQFPRSQVPRPQVLIQPQIQEQFADLEQQQEQPPRRNFVLIGFIVAGTIIAVNLIFFNKIKF